jgi:cobalt-zinc-cadmium efflux system outer membrane protein
MKLRIRRWPRLHWRISSGAACVLGFSLPFAVVVAAEPEVNSVMGGEVLVLETADAQSGSRAGVEALIAEALLHNPEIAAARAESEAARQRIAPSTALDDPMLEAGIVNAPLPYSLRREGMTMKMLGLTQKLPYPGKRALRHDVAIADAASVEHAVDEAVDRVQRDVCVNYEELGFATTSQQLIAHTRAALSQLEAVAEQRHAIGQATQSDVLLAQAQVVRMQQEQLRLDREQQLRRSELRRLLGRRDDSVPIVPLEGKLLSLPATAAELSRAAHDHRPQLQALAALVAKGDSEVALARREYFPDFELRVSYGQRDRTLDGLPRDDMVTMSVAVNLPIRRGSRLGPRVAEATAMRRQAENLLLEQQLETQSDLERELAIERQQRTSVSLYHSTLIPQTEAAYDSTLSAYRLGKIDFTTLMEARMRVYEARIGEAEAVAEHNKAIAEIDFLVGRGAATSDFKRARP